MEAAGAIGVVWDGPATTKELTALAGAGDLYEASHIKAWASELIEKYSRHLARRSLLTTELRCIRTWPSYGLVTAEQAADLEAQARARMYQATPQREPSAPPSVGTGDDVVRAGKVACPSFIDPNRNWFNRDTDPSCSESTPSYCHDDSSSYITGLCQPWCAYCVHISRK